jgi:hypothetical protein
LVGRVIASRGDTGSNIKAAVNIWTVLWHKQGMATTYIVMEELWTCVQNVVAAWRQTGFVLLEKFTYVMLGNSRLLITPCTSLMNVQMKMPLLKF